MVCKIGVAKYLIVDDATPYGNGNKSNYQTIHHKIFEHKVKHIMVVRRRKSPHKDHNVSFQ
jgi:hypothetical protein